MTNAVACCHECENNLAMICRRKGGPKLIIFCPICRSETVFDVKKMLKVFDNQEPDLETEGILLAPESESVH